MLVDITEDIPGDRGRHAAAALTVIHILHQHSHRKGQLHIIVEAHEPGVADSLPVQ